MRKRRKLLSIFLSAGLVCLALSVSASWLLSRPVSAVVDAEFEQVRKVIERTMRPLASPGKPISGYGITGWYTDRKAKQKIDVGKKARYTISAVAVGEGGKKRRVSCTVELKTTDGGVQIRCRGRSWNVSTFFPETRWESARFLKETLQELGHGETIEWGNPSKGLRIGMAFVPRPKDKYPQVLIYVQNVGESALDMCPPPTSLLAPHISVSAKGNSSARERRNKTGYIARLEYAGKDGKGYGAVVTGNFMASGASFHEYMKLQPGERRLWARDDLRMRDIDGPKKHIVLKNGLAPGTYRLRIRLSTEARHADAQANESLWQGSVECESKPFAASGS